LRLYPLQVGRSTLMTGTRINDYGTAAGIFGSRNTGGPHRA
jgi:hypothetical protein